MKFIATIKKRQNDGEEYLELVFNEHTYEFEQGADYVKNEKDSNIVALTYAGIIKIANEEGVTFETKDWIKLAYNHITIRVVATRKDGLSREAVVGRNKDNMQSDGKGDEDTAAHKKACVEAFLALYGIASSRFNIASGKAEPKKSGTGINMNAIDNNVSEDSVNDTPAPTTSTTVTPSNTDAPNTPSTSNDTANESSAEENVTMPFGEYRGQKIFDVLRNDTDNKALDYFSRLFFKNQAIKGNKVVSNAIFAYYEKNGATAEQQEKIDSIRKSIS